MICLTHEVYKDLTEDSLIRLIVPPSLRIAPIAFLIFFTLLEMWELKSRGFPRKNHHHQWSHLSHNYCWHPTCCRLIQPNKSPRPWQYLCKNHRDTLPKWKPCFLRSTNITLAGLSKPLLPPNWLKNEPNENHTSIKQIWQSTTQIL